MQVFKTVQGWAVSDVINGYLKHVHYIGYTKREAIKKFLKDTKQTRND